MTGRRRPGGRGVLTGSAAAVAALLVGGCSSAPDPAVTPTSTSRRTPTSTTSTSTTVVPGALASGPEETALAVRLDALRARTPGGCLVVARRGTIVYDREAGAPPQPASVVKVLTAGAALELLGPGYRFRTTVRSFDPPVDGVVGDLWLVGGGDPVLGTDAWAASELRPDAPRTSLDELADAVVAAGVRRVDGSVIGDDSRHDAVRYVAGWPQRLVDDGESGPVSALVVNDGFRVWGHPGVPFEVPAAGAAEAFHDLLVSGGVVVAGRPGPGVAPNAVAELAAVQSPPVGDLVAGMLRESDNGTAELLVKEMAARVAGGPGTTADGVAAVTEALRSRGVDVAGDVVADGSGLSDLTRVRCRTLVGALTAWRDELHGRLAVAGRSGTLRSRFTGTALEGRLRAKTGSLDGVSALAGFVEGTTGELTFAAILEGPGADARGREFQDAVVAVLAAA